MNPHLCVKDDHVDPRELLEEHEEHHIDEWLVVCRLGEQIHQGDRASLLLCAVCFLDLFQLSLHIVVASSEPPQTPEGSLVASF